MIRPVRQSRGRRVGTFLIGVCVVLLAAAGCGTEGNVAVDLPPTPRSIVPAITGTVFAPGGQTSPGTCLADLSPEEGTLNVVLWLVDSLDAKDGHIDNPFLLMQNRTNGEGLYEILLPGTTQVGGCGLMVAVGSGDSLTRAFAVSHSTNLDAVSEAVVRVVLDRLTKAPPVQLCDFSAEGLSNILEKAKNAACSARGSTIAEVNDAAYQRVRVNAAVKQAIDDATRVPVAGG